MFLAQNHRSWVLTFPFWDKSGASTFSTWTNDVILLKTNKIFTVILKSQKQRNNPVWCLCCLSQCGCPLPLRRKCHMFSLRLQRHMIGCGYWSAEPGPDRGEDEDETCSTSQCCCFLFSSFFPLFLFYFLHYLYPICVTCVPLSALIIHYIQ